MDSKIIILKNEVERLYNEGKITWKKLNEERERINKMTPEEIDKEINHEETYLKEIVEEEKISIKKKSKSSTPSFENEQLKLLTSIDKNTQSLKKWITFWSWVSIVSIVIGIFIILADS